MDCIYYKALDQFYQYHKTTLFVDLGDSVYREIVTITAARPDKSITTNLRRLCV